MAERIHDINHWLNARSNLDAVSCYAYVHVCVSMSVHRSSIRCVMNSKRKVKLHSTLLYSTLLNSSLLRSTIFDSISLYTTLPYSNPFFTTHTTQHNTTQLDTTPYHTFNSCARVPVTGATNTISGSSL